MEANGKIDGRAAGWCGILAGIGLTIEAFLWQASGWTPGSFANAAAALEFVSRSGTTLRWAVAAGFVNLGFLVLFTVGVAERLSSRSSTMAAASLWFGMIGITLHLLVPLAHWYGVPEFTAASRENPGSVEGAWMAFNLVAHEAAGGGGKLFMGLSLLSVGAAILLGKTLPAYLGWLALLGGGCSVLTLFAPETALSTVATAAFMPSLMLSILFRVAGGMALLKSHPRHLG